MDPRRRLYVALTIFIGFGLTLSAAMHSVSKSIDQAIRSITTRP